MSNLIHFGITPPAKKGESARVKNQAMTVQEFFEFMRDARDISSVSISGTEDKARYNRKKSRADGIVATSLNGTRRKADIGNRSILFYDLDRVDARTVRRVKRAFRESGLAHVFHTTTGDRHELKEGLRCIRVLVLTDKPVESADFGRAQYALLHSLGLEDIGFDDCTVDTNRLVYLPHAQSVVECHDGNLARVRRLLRLADKLGIDPEEDKELIEDLNGDNQAISDWCFEQGFEPLSSGRGYEVPCPNEHLHSGEGSTAIMLDGKEMRFVCMHSGNGCCSELNRHQHLALRLLGMPDHINVAPHQISKKQIAEMLPGLDDEEVAAQYEHVTDAVGDGEEFGICTDADLEDEKELPFTKHDPIIEGLANFRSTWYAAGESNIGKSFFILGEMAAASAGIPFAGAKVVKSHSFYFDAEGGESTAQRKEALQLKYQDDLEWLHIVDLQARGWDITSKAGLREVIAFINKTAGEDPVGLIAFDSLNQTVALRSDKPFDENSATDMGEVVKALKAIAERTGGSPGVIHHPAKSSHGNRSPRGSSALHGAVDMAFFIEQPDENQPGQINLYHEKMRNGTRQAPRGFVLLKCKVSYDERKSAEFTSYQSTNPGPDWGDITAGHTVKPVTVSPRDETLYLVPVALEPFGTTQIVKKQATEAKEGPRNKKEAEFVAALEALMEANPGHKGFSKSAILRQAGYEKGGTNTTAINALIERGVFKGYKDPDTGVIMGSSNLVIPDGIERELVATDDDLAD